MKNELPPTVGGGVINAVDRYRTFAHLAADWVWELDANLCYVFYDGPQADSIGLSRTEFAGKNRIELLDDNLIASEQLSEHHQRLLEHQSIDLIIPVSPKRDALSDIQFVNVIAEPKFDESGCFTGYLGCGRDVTKRVNYESELAHLATHDDLTGVMNRREFEKQLTKLHQNAKTGGEPFSLCFIDLDRFKQVNDNGGHHAGDQLLRELVLVIQKHILPDEILARLGGDEFGLLLKSDAQAAGKIVDKIIDAISCYRFFWEANTYQVGASVGIAQITQESASANSLMVDADNACYSAKKNGRNQSYVSGNDLLGSTEIGKPNSKIDAIREAIQDNRYQLLMQPVVSVSGKESFKRCEILLRLQCSNGELLEPSEFMPIAKRYALLNDLDYWVVESALYMLNHSDEQGNDLFLSINLSASTLSSAIALNSIVELLASHKNITKRICFEITETYAIRNMDMVRDFMTTLKRLGVEFALDDFGNSLSSVTHLQVLPIDYLKLDGELIRKLSTDETVRCITASFHELSQKLGIRTVAESVEDSATIACIEEIGIDYMQGFGVADLEMVNAKELLRNE